MPRGSRSRRGRLAFDSAAGGLSFDRELRVLAETRQFILLRTICVAAAVLFSLVPFTFTWGSAGVHFLLLGHFPGLVWSSWSLAAASWAAVLGAEPPHPAGRVVGRGVSGSGDRCGFRL